MYKRGFFHLYIQVCKFSVMEIAHSLLKTILYTIFWLFKIKGAMEHHEGRTHMFISNVALHT